MVQSARTLLEGLVGKTIRTLTGTPNSVLRIDGDSVFVATAKSPAGEPIPIRDLQAALDRLYKDGRVAINVNTVGRRSAFIGAALATVPGTVTSTGPRLVRLASPLRPLLGRALAEVPKPRPERYSGADPFAVLFTQELRAAVQGIVGDSESYLVAGSAGQGNWADTPWVAVFDRLVTESAQTGYYVVYLFRRDGSGVYLSLNQGTTAVWEQAKSRYQEVLGDRARMYCGLLGSQRLADFTVGRIALGGGSTQLTPGYEAGSILARLYLPGSMPSEAALSSDLRSMLDVYSALIEALDRTDQTESEGPGAPPKTQQEARQLHWHLRAEGRNRTAAKEAKRLLGYTCQACHFNFEARYGAIGKEYIEAHHLIPFSDLNERPRKLDPARDFAVVCSNCHRMLHQRIPPLTLRELRELMRPARTLHAEHESF